jgi:diadenosine tetraphosphate (Ap4A) HIT family hydrolase
MILESREKWYELTNWKDTIWKNNCPFCWELSQKEEEKKLIILELQYWKIIHNKFPYANLKNHLLVVPKNHIESTKDLSLEEFWELKKVEEFMSEYYWNQNYFSFIRETNWWKSIKHLHYHFLPWILYSTHLEKSLIRQNLK